MLQPVCAELNLTMSKKAFLAKASNKQIFFNLLAVHTVLSGTTVAYIEGILATKFIIWSRHGENPSHSHGVGTFSSP